MKVINLDAMSEVEFPPTRILTVMLWTNAVTRKPSCVARTVLHREIGTSSGEESSGILNARYHLFCTLRKVSRLVYFRQAIIGDTKTSLTVKKDRLITQAYEGTLVGREKISKTTKSLSIR